MRSDYSPGMLMPTLLRIKVSLYVILDLASPRRVSGMLLFLCVLVFLQSAQAQNVQRTNEAVDLGLRGNLTVNPATRAVELQIPLGNFPGRAGHNKPVTISYSSKVWNIKFQSFVPGPPPQFPGVQPFSVVEAKYSEHSASGWNSTTWLPIVDQQPGWQLYNQFGQPWNDSNCSGGCFVIDRVMAWMPDGSGHELRSSDQAILSTQRPDNLYSVDGSRMRYQRSTNTLFLPDGSRYVLSNPGSYIDRNGNTINATDTLGRTIPSPPFASQPGDFNYSLPGVGVGGTVNYIFKWRNLADVLTTAQPLAKVGSSGCPPGQSSYSPSLFFSDISGRTCINNAAQLFNPVVLSQLVLPTGQAYTFTYNIYGEIDKVTLPTGGYEKYFYGYVAPLSASSSVYAQYNRGVTTRTVSATGLSADEVSWQYSGGSVYVKMVAPDGSWTERYAWSDGNSAWGYSLDGARAGRAYDERVYSPTNQMLRRKLTEWAMTGSNGGGFDYMNYANRNARVTRETEFIFETGGVLARTTTYGYDLTYQFDVGIDQTSVSQYDYVSVDQYTAENIAIASLSSIPTGTLLRTTQTAYLTGNANYRSRNIVGLPTSTKVYQGLPTDTNVMAQSSISYDEGGQFAQLNDYTGVHNWTDPQTPYRGNATTTSQWLNNNGGAPMTYPNGTYLSSHAQYDQCGSVRKTWDPLDTLLTNPSQVSYLDAFSDGVHTTYAFPTAVTTKVPDSNGVYGSNVAFTSTSIYDFNTGKIVSTTDPNGKTTTYDYTDSLNRLRQVTLPDAGRVRYNYFDSPGDLYIQVLTDEDSSRSIETRKYFDGLGRLIRGFLYDGTASTPWVVSDIYYDNLGRVSKVANPYRVSNPSGSVPACSTCATTGYDSLGRVLTVTTADNAQRRTSYGVTTSGTLGTTLTITDQAGRMRRSVSDGLGRMIRVDEPNKDTGSLDVGGTSTSYTYDVLGNLRQVTQSGQYRYFMYDSLSRLIRVKNPEQLVNSNLALTDPVTNYNGGWSLAYTYDANGNVLTRIDARNVTSTNAYDALNRNISVTYSDGTPTARRYFDSATNGRGRLHWEEAVGVSANVFDAYDAMGRTTQFHQRFWVNGTWGQYFNITRTYDKAGHVLTQTYPSGHTVNYGYDIAGRVNNDTGNIGDGVTRTYATAATYGVFGGLQEEQFGTQTPLYHKLHYNVRGQLYDVRLSTLSMQADEFDWNRGAVVNYLSANYIFGGSGTDNNGNLLRQSSYIPSTSPGAYNFSEDTFSYDFLNRLTSVTERPGTQGGIGAPAFTQMFDYDVYGNRTISTATTQLNGINRIQTSISPATNRLFAPGETDQSHFLIDYDKGGNQIKDYYSDNRSDNLLGRSYDRTYDAENRMITSTVNYSGGGSPLSIYTYDASGHRVKRKIGTVETWQVYGLNGELLSEYQAGIAPYLPTTEYGYRSGELLTKISSGDTQRLTRFVTNLYYGALQRDPTPQELQDKVNQLAAAGIAGPSQLLTTASQIARSLFISTNYETSPFRSNTQYVSDLYYAYLQRGPDDSGLNWWAVTVLPGSTRENVCNAFEGSGEFQTIVATLYGTSSSDNQRTENFVNNFYRGAFGRDATTTELQQQRDSLNAEAAKGQTFVQTQSETMGRALFAGQVNDLSISNTQYVTNLYEAFLQRGPDSGGLGFWTGQTNGQGRQFVLNQFATCGPFRELAGTLYREAFWLVSDQVGSPRIIVNKSGTLSGVKRHDYLPFGEELDAFVGGRTPTQGYSGDNLRQKFTQKERDNETGLDYFLARSYSSSQGRFTSPDSFGGRAANPQTLNLYSYVLNNPLKYVDPTGHQEQDKAPQLPPEEVKRIHDEAIAEGTEVIVTNTKGKKDKDDGSGTQIQFWDMPSPLGGARYKLCPTGICGEGGRTIGDDRDVIRSAIRTSQAIHRTIMENTDSLDANVSVFWVINFGVHFTADGDVFPEYTPPQGGIYDAIVDSQFGVKQLVPFSFSVTGTHILYGNQPQTQETRRQFYGGTSLGAGGALPVIRGTGPYLGYVYSPTNRMSAVQAGWGSGQLGGAASLSPNKPTFSFESLRWKPK